MTKQSSVNEINEMLQIVKGVLRDAATPVQNASAPRQSFSTRFCNWVKNSEQDLTTYNRQQQTMEQQQLIVQASLSLKHLLSYALNRVPSHLDFWGDLSPHSIHLIYSSGVWSFPLIHSLDAHAMPVTFHQTAEELQKILLDIYANALHVLTEKIRTDSEIYAEQYLNAQYCAFMSCKSDQSFLNDYRVYYRAYSHYLWQISGVSMAPISNGVSVSFTAMFDDCCLSPACYWQNMCSVLRI